jgi:cell division septum initiation protein DivIVA
MLCKAIAPAWFAPVQQLLNDMRQKVTNFQQGVKDMRQRVDRIDVKLARVSPESIKYLPSSNHVTTADQCPEP